MTLLCLKNLALCLQTNETLDNLSLSHNGLTYSLMLPLIESNHKLISIDLSYNKLDQYFATLFARSFKTHTEISSIDLSNNKISDVGAAMIARHAEHLTLLKNLDMSSNGITKIGGYFVDKALKSIGKPDSFKI